MNANILIGTPWALVLLAGLFLLWWWSSRSLDSLSIFRRRLSLFIRFTLYSLVVLALADISYETDTSRRVMVWMVDVSDSVGDETWNQYKKISSELGDSPFDHEITLNFAGKTAPVRMLEEAEDRESFWNSLELNTTRMGRALQFAQASLPPGYSPTFALFSDGISDDALKAEFSNLEASGIQVHVFPTEMNEKPEVLIHRIRAPSRVREGEPFQITVEVRSSQPTEAVLKVFLNGVLIHNNKVTLSSGSNHFSFQQQIRDQALAEYNVLIESQPGTDHYIDNNRLTHVVHAGGRSRGLLITDRPASARYLRLSLKQENLDLEVRGVDGAPVSMADIRNFDLLMLDNIPATELSRHQMKVIVEYVRDFGGGMIMLGGDQSFGLGGYYRTPIETLLPVRCDFEKEREDPALGLALIIDKSSSMSGESKIEMAKEAAKAAVGLLAPKDYAGVVVFDSQAFWAAEMQPVVDKFALIEMISTINPGGGTDISPAMDLAYNQLALTPAKIRHAVILTDGQSREGPFYEITSRMAADNITVSTIGIGRTADQALLEQIARWGNGRFYFTDDASRIPQIFARETMTVSKSAIKEIPFLPQVIKSGDFLGNLDFSTAPYLYGYVVTRPKPTSEIWLATENSEPLLATWRYGLGNVAAFTSDARNRWAVEWLHWAGFGTFWSQLYERIRKTDTFGRLPVSLEQSEEEFTLRVEMKDEFEEQSQSMGAVVIITGPDSRKEFMTLEELMPGQWSVSWKKWGPGNYHIDLKVKSGQSEETSRQYLTASVGYGREYRLEPTDVELLSELATLTGGEVNPDIETLRKKTNLSSVREIKLSPWFLGFALFLFLVDVAVKRLRIFSRP